MTFFSRTHQPLTLNMLEQPKTGLIIWFYLQVENWLKNRIQVLRPSGIYFFPNYLINWYIVSCTQSLNTFRSQWRTSFLLQLQNNRSHSTDIFSIFGSFWIKIAQFGNAFPFCTWYQLKKNIINYLLVYLYMIVKKLHF